MSGKQDDDYWNSSIAGFNWDDKKEIIKSPTSTYLSSTSTKDNAIFNSMLEESDINVIPIHSLISKKNLDAVLNDVRLPLSFATVSAEQTVKNIFLGRPHNLYSYRTLEQKIELLDCAIELLDGNAIMTIILYMVKTVKLSIVHHYLSKRKVAFQHYASYLIQHSKLNDFVELCMATGNNSEIVKLFYITCKDTSNKQHLNCKIKQFVIEHLDKLNSSRDKLIILDQANFIEWQIAHKMDCTSVTEQLALICKNQWEKNKGSNDSDILEFKKIFKINDFQFEWIELNVLSSMQMWEKLIQLFIKPNRLTKKQSIKTAINLELFVLTLHQHNAPMEVLEKFLLLITDLEKRVYLAKRTRCHKFVIDYYINQKDTAALADYKTTLPAQSATSYYVESVLRSLEQK